MAVNIFQKYSYMHIRYDAILLTQWPPLLSVADEVSLADPDDILDRFMAKQRYNR